MEPVLKKIFKICDYRFIKINKNLSRAHVRGTKGPEIVCSGFGRGLVPKTTSIFGYIWSPDNLKEQPPQNSILTPFDPV